MRLRQGLTLNVFSDKVGGEHGYLEIAIEPTAVVSIGFADQKVCHVWYTNGATQLLMECSVGDDECDILRALCGFEPLESVEDMLTPD